MTTEIVLDPGGANEKTLTEDDIVRINPVRTHTGKSDLRGTLAYNRDLDAFAQRQNRVNVKIDGTVQWTGYIVGASHSERNGTTTIQADGIAKKLEENRPDYASLGGSLSYSNIALEDAIDDYWDRTSFSSHSVTAESTETVATDETIQDVSTNSGFQNISSLSSTDPFIIQNNQFERAQSGYFSEGENPDSGAGASSSSDNEASDGTAEVMNTTTHSISFDFNLDYDIQESNVDVGVRWRANDDPDNDSDFEIPEWEVKIDGTSTDISFVQCASIGSDNYRWSTGTNWSSGDLTAGSHTVTVDILSECTINSSTTNIYVDCVFLYDTQFSYTFDNTVDSNGYLSGPELYPGPSTAEFDNNTVSYHVTDGTVNITANNTANSQKIQVSFDGGSTYTPTNGNEDNTTSVNPSSSANSRQIRGRVSLDGTDDTRSTATPTSKYKGQHLDSWKLLASGDNLSVIDDLELSRNHFDNLQELHQYGGFLWVIEHDGSSLGNMTVTSFQEGDESRSKPSGFDDPVQKNPEVAGGNYYNKIYIQGAEDSNGNRPTAELKDSTAISNDDREISPGVIRDPKITTDAGATFRARSLLDSAQNNSDLVGSITVIPTIVDPGYLRPVDLGNGDVDKTVEEVSLNLSPGSATATFIFSLPEDISEEITRLKSSTRGIGDKV